jgi:hypothetical protein
MHVTRDSVMLFQVLWADFQELKNIRWFWVAFLFVDASLNRGADALKWVSLSGLIGINCLMAWFVDLKEENLFLDDTIEAYS